MSDSPIPDRPDRPSPSAGHDAALARFFSSIPATVWMTDEHLVLTFVEGVYLRRLQVDPRKVIGRTIQDILLDGREDHPLIQGHLTALSGHENTVRVEWGGRLYNVRLAPLRDGDDRVIGCVGVHLEIGWLPDDEGTLRESDVRLRRVVDSNMMGIAFGDDQGRISDANDAFLQLAGYTREDLLDDTVSWPALMPIEAHQRQIQALEEILATGRCVPFETEIIRKTGDRVPVLVGAARLSARRREGVAFVLDITDRKRTVWRLKAELESADLLAGARAAADAAGPLLGIFRTALSWGSAAWWSSTVEGWRLVAQVGEAADAGESLARQAEQMRANVSSPDKKAMAIPLMAADACLGVLVLAGWANGQPDVELIETCRRIAGRIATSIAAS